MMYLQHHNLMYLIRSKDLRDFRAEKRKLKEEMLFRLVCCRQPRIVVVPETLRLC